MSDYVRSSEVVRCTRFRRAVGLGSSEVRIPSILLCPQDLILYSDGLMMFGRGVSAVFRYFRLPSLAFRCNFKARKRKPNSFFLPSVSPIRRGGGNFIVLSKVGLGRVDIRGSGTVMRASALGCKFGYFGSLVDVSSDDCYYGKNFRGRGRFEFLCPSKGRRS